MRRQIIFLDIDGVLNCKSSLERENTWRVIDDDKLNHLITLIQRCNNQMLMIHSSWRFSEDSRLAIHELFSKIEELKHFIFLPSIWDHSNWNQPERDFDISFWLINNQQWDDEFVIIDDCRDEFTSQDLIDHLCLTTFEEGFTLEKMSIAKSILKIK